MSGVVPTQLHLQSAPTVVLGVVGGIGSGKSAVARWAAEHNPEVEVIDADKLGHEVLRDAGIIRRLADRFGLEVVDENGDINRARLAERVFGDAPQSVAARKDLERIVHPEIRRRFYELMQVSGRGILPRIILLDAAILLEAGWQDLCRWVIFVECPPETRRQRVQTLRGWSEEELERREASQWSLATKRRYSDVIIDNSGDLAHAGSQLTKVIRRCREFCPAVTE